MCTDWTAANPLATRANAASFCWLKHCQEWKVQGRRWNAKHWKTSANVPALFYPACDGQFLHNLYPVNSVCWGREILGLQTIKHLQLNLGPDAECLQGTVCHQTYAISPSLLIVTLSATLFHSGVLPQCKTTLACYCDVRPSSVTPVWFAMVKCYYALPDSQQLTLLIKQSHSRDWSWGQACALCVSVTESSHQALDTI